MPHLKLKDAYFCINCETVSTHFDVCVSCLSMEVYPLAKFLNRSADAIEVLSHSCADLPGLPCLACAQ